MDCDIDLSPLDDSPHSSVEGSTEISRESHVTSGAYQRPPAGGAVDPTAFFSCQVHKRLVREARRSCAATVTGEDPGAPSVFCSFPSGVWQRLCMRAQRHASFGIANPIAASSAMMLFVCEKRVDGFCSLSRSIFPLLVQN